VPGGDDLDDLIDGYVADALRVTGVHADSRAKRSTSQTAPRDPIPVPANPVIIPRSRVPTPIGVAVLAAELFGDVPDEVTPPPFMIDDGRRAAPRSVLLPSSDESPPVESMPAMPVGPSITFKSSGQHVSIPAVPPASDLYMMPPIPALSDVGDRSVPETLPGIGPQLLQRETFPAGPPTEPDAEPAMADPDDEPTNVVTTIPRR
jgi:hypothetical protein